jgi:putative tryptophan/tyrosine transport system substrate-binding protein
LAAYGSNLRELISGAAAHVDRTHKGARPANLPVQLPARFDLVINLRTAQELGLTIFPSVLQQATEIIQ